MPYGPLRHCPVSRTSLTVTVLTEFWKSDDFSDTIRQRKDRQVSHMATASIDTMQRTRCGSEVWRVSHGVESDRIRLSVRHAKEGVCTPNGRGNTLSVLRQSRGICRGRTVDDQSTREIAASPESMHRENGGRIATAAVSPSTLARHWVDRVILKALLRRNWVV